MADGYTLFLEYEAERANVTVWRRVNGKLIFVVSGHGRGPACKMAALRDASHRRGLEPAAKAELEELLRVVIDAQPKSTTD